VTEFGSFDNSTFKRVLDLLKPGDLTLGQVVIKRVAVVELGVINVSKQVVQCKKSCRLIGILYVFLYLNFRFFAAF